MCFVFTCRSDKLRACASSAFLLMVMQRLQWNSFSSSSRWWSLYTTRYLSLVRVRPAGDTSKVDRLRAGYQAGCLRAGNEPSRSVKLYNHGEGTVRTELHRHPEVPTLSTYIQWKTEDDHTYHNRQNEIKMNLNLFYNCFICFNVSKK